MNKQRLETFSDGVFAIVITLLILTIRVPDVSKESLSGALVGVLPEALTYVLSFFVVAVYWLVHHRVSYQVRRVDGPLIWLNMLWLLFVSVMPFPTALLARYPLQPIPIALYGCDLILANVVGFLITLYMRNHPHMSTTPDRVPGLRTIVPGYLITNGAYVIAVGLAWVLPWCSYLIYAAVLVRLSVRYSKGTSGHAEAAH